MAMYDILGDDYQVKCFTMPCFYYSTEAKKAGERMMGFMSGSVRFIQKDEEVPYKTLWYKYPKDFMIVDVAPFVPPSKEEADSAIHIIRGGKYKATYKLAWDIPDDEFVPEAFDYMGNHLRRMDSKDVLGQCMNIMKLESIARTRYLKQQSEMNELIRRQEKLRMMHVDPKEKRFQEARIKLEMRTGLTWSILRERKLMTQEKCYAEENRFEKKLGLFGAYLECYPEYYTSELENPNNSYYHGVSKAMREEFAALLRECPELTLEKFFEWNETEPEDRVCLQTVYNALCGIEEKEDGAEENA